MAKKNDISSAQLVLVVLGLIAWAVVGVFASQDMFRVVERGGAVAVAPNNVAAAGVFGFALAGGLCFLGFGLAARRNGSGPPPGSPSDERLAEPGTAAYRPGD